MMDKEELLALIKKEGNVFRFEYSGFKCLCRRHINSEDRISIESKYAIFNWCGYVGVPEGHLYYKKSDRDIDCHGGVTFSGFIEEEKDGLWYIGFDCAHAGDLCMMIMLSRNEVYRDLEYVKNQCKKIADQLDPEEIVLRGI